MLTIKPSKPFSNGMSYEFFLESFCYRCKHGKINDDGFAEYPEKGGCKKGEAMGKVLGAVALAIALCAAANIDAWFLIVLFWMTVAWWCMTD